MKAIKDILDGLRPHFEKGGRWEKLYPLFEATETFFFLPAHRTETGPHVRDALELKRFMGFVILALIPHFLFGIYNCGYQSQLASGDSLAVLPVIWRGLILVLPLVIVSYAVGMFWELLFAAVRKHEVSEGFFVTGMLYPLTLPPTLPLWQAAVGISFGVVIGKEVFGGTGRNILNPALTARAFVFFAYPAYLSGNVWVAVKEGAKNTADAVSGATPLAIAADAGPSDMVEPLLNQAGYDLSTLFWGLYPGSIGATSAFLCLIGAVFLMAVGIASYRIIIGGVIGALATGYLLNLVAGPASMPWLSVSPIYHLLMGGFAFGIAYMATDPVSAPGMDGVKWLYGFLIGMLTVLIRVFNPAFPEGIMLAILFMNVFSALLDQFEIRLKTRKRIPNT